MSYPTPTSRDKWFTSILIIFFIALFFATLWFFDDRGTIDWQLLN